MHIILAMTVDAKLVHMNTTLMESVITVDGKVNMGVWYNGIMIVSKTSD